MKPSNLLKRLIFISALLLLLLAAAVLLGISIGSTGNHLGTVLGILLKGQQADSVLATIIWRIRLPRVILAFLVGATLSLGGLVFQALLRNPLAEPYILGISGGSAIGAIIGILLGFSYFPGVGIMAFSGSIATLLLLLVMSSGHTVLKKNSMADIRQVGILVIALVPCFLLIFWLSNTMNLLLMGKEMAQTLGINIKLVTLTLLVTTSFMVSATVSFCGLIGFVGLVMPHLLRLFFGPDHRILVPACILGGGAYLVFCDLMAKILPRQGEMPAGVITAMIGAPLFIFLLKRTRQ
jgi:iron complex transport system permease protein